MIRITFSLPEKYHKALKNLSLKYHLSITQLVKQAIEHVYFSNKKKKTAKDLWGCAEGSSTSETKLKEIKLLLNPK